MAEYQTLSTPINKTREYHGLSSRQSDQFKIKNQIIYKWEWQDYLSGKLCGKSHKTSREINPLKIHWRQQTRTDSKFLINHCLVLVETLLDSKDTVRKTVYSQYKFSLSLVLMVKKTEQNDKGLPKLSSMGSVLRSQTLLNVWSHQNAPGKLPHHISWPSFH
jgi:hypothetical protein